MYHHQVPLHRLQAESAAAPLLPNNGGGCHFFWVYQAMTSSLGAGDMSCIAPCSHACMCEQMIDFTGSGACPALKGADGCKFTIVSVVHVMHNMLFAILPSCERSVLASYYSTHPSQHVHVVSIRSCSALCPRQSNCKSKPQRGCLSSLEHLLASIKAW